MFDPTTQTTIIKTENERGEEVFQTLTGAPASVRVVSVPREDLIKARAVAEYDGMLYRHLSPCGNKIQAIRYIRDITGLGLADSKALYEQASEER